MGCSVINAAWLMQDWVAFTHCQLFEAVFSVAQTKLHKEAWGAALSRAKGEKLLDDPKLLRKEECRTFPSPPSLSPTPSFEVHCHLRSIRQGSAE